MQEDDVQQVVSYWAPAIAQRNYTNIQKTAIFCGSKFNARYFPCTKMAYLQKEGNLEPCCICLVFPSFYPPQIRVFSRERERNQSTSFIVSEPLFFDRNPSFGVFLAYLPHFMYRWFWLGFPKEWLLREPPGRRASWGNGMTERGNSG